jgi:hypothetical protein
VPEERGRVNQKRRTRAAIIAACQELITAGADIRRSASTHSHARSD